MNTLRNIFGAVAMTALVATAASAQGVGSVREDVSGSAILDRTKIPDRTKARHPTKAERGNRAFAGAPGERSAYGRSRAAAFDGDWSVVIMTQAGPCDRAYRYGVRIENGEVLNAGSEPVNLEGHVAPSGVVQVSVAAGGQEAHGAGRLSRTSGSGNWQGGGSAGTCAGTWVAERRE